MGIWKQKHNPRGLRHLCRMCWCIEQMESMYIVYQYGDFCKYLTQWELSKSTDIFRWVSGAFQWMGTFVAFCLNCMEFCSFVSKLRFLGFHPGNVFMPPGNKLLPELMITRACHDNWHDYTTKLLLFTDHKSLEAFRSPDNLSYLMISHETWYNNGTLSYIDHITKKNNS